MDPGSEVQSRLAEGYRRESYWLDSVGENLDPGPALEGEARGDVVIVGAGFGGLWAAYHLLQEAPDLSIVILESEIAGFGASGRNGGAVGAWVAGINAWAADPQTRSGAVAIQRAVTQTVRRIGEICGREGIDCHYARDGMVMAATNRHQRRFVDEYAKFFAGLGFADVFRVISGDEARRYVNIERMEGALWCAEFAAIHPARLARGLARVLRSKGVRIYERSRVIRVEKGAARTAGGVVRAPTVILALEAYSVLLEGYGRHVAPVHSQIIATEPLGSKVEEKTGVKGRPYFSVLSPLPLYSQLTADSRIILGTRDDYDFGSRIRSADEFGIHTSATRFVHKRLLDTFPGLRDVPITHCWGGPLAVSRNRKPFVFFDRRRGLGWLGGYSGSGLSPSCLAGETMADLVLGRDTERTALPWVVSDLPRRWEPEPVRWIGITAHNLWLETLDRFMA